MRKTVWSTWLAILATLVIIESVSSYALFRYYAHAHKSLRPGGSAAAMVLDGVINRIRGIHPRPVFAIDHGPLFEPNADLGFALRPGRHRISETLGPQVHAFTITVTEARTRATAYVPLHSAARLFTAGDSSMFGWGLNDEQTLPWFIQTRLSNYEVVNLSMTSYSTVQALIQLRTTSPKIGPADVVAIEYHQLSNQLNVESFEVLMNIRDGYEMALGSGSNLINMELPYGALDAHGNLEIRHVKLSCVNDDTRPGCDRPRIGTEASMQVTKRAFDAIMELHPAHLVIAFVYGDDSDPVIEYMRSRGATIADLRNDRAAPFDEDLISTDGHSGPFWQYEVASRLLDIMQQEHIVQLP